MRFVRAGLLLAAMTLVSGPAVAQDADVANGEKVFKKCFACHTIEPGKKKIGPSLHGVVGRQAGLVEDFKYSDALLESGIVWDEETQLYYATGTTPRHGAGTGRSPHRFIRRGADGRTGGMMDRRRRAGAADRAPRAPQILERA